jgi:hypothetical protein
MVSPWSETRSKRLHQRPVDQELAVRQARRHLAVGENRRHHLARHIRCQQPVAVLAEHRRPRPASSMPRPTNHRNGRLHCICSINCRIVPNARIRRDTTLIIAMAVNEDGKREVLGVATGPSEAETFWTEFLRSLADRGLRGAKLVIADDHKGLRAAARRVFNGEPCRAIDGVDGPRFRHRDVPGWWLLSIPPKGARRQLPGRAWLRTRSPPDASGRRRQLHRFKQLDKR